MLRSIHVLTSLARPIRGNKPISTKLSYSYFPSSGQPFLAIILQTRKCTLPIPRADPANTSQSGLGTPTTKRLSH